MELTFPFHIAILTQDMANRAMLVNIAALGEMLTSSKSIYITRMYVTRQNVTAISYKP